MPTKPIHVGTIDNTGPNRLVSFLRTAGAGCVNIDVAVAFVTSAGLDIVLNLLQRTASLGRVRFLTGLYQGFTEPKALRTLLRAQEETGGKLSAHVSTVTHFHWKCYFLLKRTSATVVIGSSNLTDDGLRQAGEFNVVLTLNQSLSEFKCIHDIFDRNWQGKSKPLNIDLLRRYESWRTEHGGSQKAARVPLSQIIGVIPREQPSRSVDRRYWLSSLNGELSDETEAVLQETTDWERRGLAYMSTWSPTYHEGDRIVLFDVWNNVLSIVEVVTMTQTPQSTPDGKHFAAYRVIRNAPIRRLVKKRWQSLKTAGLIQRRDDVFSGKKLSERKFNAFVENVKQVAR